MSSGLGTRLVELCMGLLVRLLWDYHIVYGFFSDILRDYGKFTGITTQLVQDYHCVAGPYGEITSPYLNPTTAPIEAKYLFIKSATVYK